MAFAKLVMEIPGAARVKLVPVGFSWTILFFGFFVPLLRGHWLFALLWFAGAVVAHLLSSLVVPPLILFVFWIVMWFQYNKLYLNHLIGQGFRIKYSSVPLEMVEASLKMLLGYLLIDEPPTPQD